jgi:pimeloyl-ACP methyl ester carboxylesterase
MCCVSPTNTDERRARARAGAFVPLNHGKEGTPVFLLHAQMGVPWVYRPLADALRLTRPILAASAPELDWERDVLSLDELVIDYLAEIRRIQPRGPYTLVGHSFGGVLAFEIALRLQRDGQDAEVILLDATPARRRMRRWQTRLFEAARSMLRRSCERGLVGARGLRRLGYGSPVWATDLCLGSGALNERELRTILRVVFPDAVACRDLETMSFEELCAALLAALRARVPARIMSSRTDGARSRTPAAQLKALKVASKNSDLARRYRSSGVFSGVVTLFAVEGNRNALRWQKSSSKPLDIRWVPARGLDGDSPHVAFITGSNVDLIAPDLKRRLEADGDGAIGPDSPTTLMPVDARRASPRS